MFRSIKARQLTCISTLALSSVFSLHGSARANEIEPAKALTGRPHGLTVDQFAKKAAATSFATEQKRQEVIAAAESLDRARYDFIPRLSGQVSYFRLSDVESGSLGNVVVAPGAAPGPLPPGQTLAAAPIAFDSLQNSTTLQGSLTLPLSDYVFRLFQARDAAEAQHESTKHSLEATRRKVDYDARALYYDWVRAELEAAAAAQNLTLSREHLGRLKALEAAESVSGADVSRAEASEASAERVLVQAQNLALLQQQRIRIAMHDAGVGALAIGEDLTTTPPERPELDDIGALTRHAEERRPELKAASFAALSYGKKADALRSKTLPRLDALASSTFANPNQRYFPQENEFNSSWQVGVQLSFSINDTLSGSADMAAARAQAKGAQAQHAQLLDAVRTEVTEAVLAGRTARAALKSSTRRLAAAETSYRARHERFLVGQATFVELTEAQTELFNAKLELVQAQVGVRVAGARIAYVSGRAP
jgi:outer membrane protein TolC